MLALTRIDSHVLQRYLALRNDQAIIRWTEHKDLPNTRQTSMRSAALPQKHLSCKCSSASVKTVPKQATRGSLTSYCTQTSTLLLAQTYTKTALQRRRSNDLVMTSSHHSCRTAQHSAQETSASEQGTSKPHRPTKSSSVHAQDVLKAGSEHPTEAGSPSRH